MKNAKLLSLLLAATMLATVGCGANNESGAEEEEILSVEVVSPVTGNIEVTSEFVGGLEYKDQTTVFPKLSGEVKETFFEEGDYVNEGDLLFTLDDEALQMGLTQAQASYKSAKAGTDQQLGAMQMTIDSDINNIKSAEEGMSQLRDTYNYYEGQYGYLQDNEDILQENLDDVKDDKHDAKKDLKKAKDALKAAKKAGLPEEDIADLSKAVSGLESAIAGYDSAIDQYQMNINQYNQNEGTMAYQKNNLVYQYQQAERQLALAQENLQYYLGIQMPAIQNSAAATLELAQVGIDSAKLQLEYTQITAPVSGIIHTKNVEVHGMAAAGTPAYVITNDGGIQVSFNVPEATYKQLSEGQSVKVVKGEETYYGVIDELPTEVDMASGMFKITAVVSGAEGLHSGLNVLVYTVTDRVDNVMMIPVDSIYYEGGSAFVYVAKGDEVNKVYIETGLYDDSNIEVVSGLNADDKIITTWSSELRNGLKVDVKAGTKEEQ